MRIRLKGTSVLAIIVMLVVSALQMNVAHANSSTDIVKNGGFEDGALHWDIPANTATVDSTVFRSGTKSLFYENTDSNNYQYFIQDIPANPGDKLTFSVWMKGENITQQTGLPATSEDGAAIFIQSYDANNNFINGVYPAGKLGTFDWQQMKDEAIIPPHAARVVVGIYMRQETVGKVWFDDVVVERAAPLVKNGSFEEGALHWDIPANTATVDTTVARSGTKSLRYENTDSNNYQLFMQDIPAEPGETLNFSVWIKGENVTQPAGKPATYEDGAAIFVQSYDANNKFIDGVYPGGLLGTFDWKEVKGRAIVPPNAARVSVGVYLRPETVGKVWFDDVVVEVEQPKLMKTNLTYPNYRHTALQGSTEAWKINLVNELTGSSADYEIRHEVRDASDQSVFVQTLPATNGNSQIEFQPNATLPLGKYSWQVELLDDSEQVVQTEQYEITIKAQMPNTYIDRDGFTIINNEKFFPMGTYLIRDWSHSDENFQLIADAGFNTLLSYTYGEADDAVDFLDRAHQHGFKVIYNVVDFYLGDEANNRTDGKDPFDVAEEYITELKDHPALLAWYINDEFDLSWMDQLERMYALITELDPNHPVLQVMNTMGILDGYYDVTDIIATDPYPVGDDGGLDTDLTMTSTFAKHTAKVARGSKGMWMVPQMHDLSIYYDWRVPNQPDAAEMLNQAYQDLIHGSKGLIFYSFFDLWFPDINRLPDEDTFDANWPVVEQMMEDLAPAIPVVMANERVDLTVVDTAAEVEIAGFVHDDQLHVMLANPYYASKTITINIPAGWQIQDQTQGVISSTVSGNTVTFQLPAVGSGIFVMEKTATSSKTKNAVTRATFTVMLMDALQLTDDVKTLEFTDSKQMSTVEQAAVARAVQRGIVTGYTDNSFKPKHPITRAEMAVMIARSISLPQVDGKTKQFADQQNIPTWAKAAVEAGASAGIWQGRSDNFAPSDSVTLAEATTLLKRMIDLQ